MSLTSNTTVLEMTLEIQYVSMSVMETLAKLFRSNNTLKKVKILSSRYTMEIPTDEETKTLITGLSNSSVIKSIDLIDFKIRNSDSLLLLLSSSCLETIKFPSSCHLSSLVIDGLMKNSSLKEVTVRRNRLEIQKFAEFLNFNNCLNKLVIDSKSCSGSYLPVFESLKSNSSLLELAIVGGESISDDDAESLSEMLTRNESLLVLHFDVLSITFSQFKTILSGMINNSTLKNVYFPPFNLGHLVLIFDALTTKKVALSEALKSNIPVQRVEGRGVSRLNLKGLIAAFEIVSINKSLVNLDVWPHSINVERQVFCFSYESYSVISTPEVSLLQKFINSFGIKKLLLRSGSFTAASMNALCDLVRVSDSLVSIEFTKIRISRATKGFDQETQSDFVYDRCFPLSHNDVSKLISAVKVNTSIKTIFFKEHFFDLKCILIMLEVFSACSSAPFITIAPHFIDCVQGTIYYHYGIDNYDLFSLLNAVKSNVHIKRLTCGDLVRPSLKEIITLFKILSIKKISH
ncbi:hypothetical protein GEMRC1_006641 [Eukaryota sp. GEM-RC1]